MQSQFDGVTPSLTEISVQVDDKNLWALAFDTSRAPFVVKNPTFGKDGGGSISREVPWREGTSVRSATRSDLIRLLTPVSHVPDIEILDGAGTLSKDNSYPNSPERVNLRFYFSLYVTPKGAHPTVIPFHRCSCRFAHNERELTQFQISINAPSRYGPGGFQPDTLSIERSGDEVAIHGPGKCVLVAELPLDTIPDWVMLPDSRLSFRLAAINVSMPVLIEAEAVPTRGGSGNVICSWALNVI
jgi:hypothetical protein